ncbi:MAG: metal ABC transporter substrate-binding protein [Spirochaetota bacterium]
MKLRYIFLNICVGIPVAISLLFSQSISAKQLNIVTTYPYIASITSQITKNTANVATLAQPTFDPHFIVPKPSYIAKLRNADLLIINGAQLEIGWLPPLVRQANNPKINTAEKGFLDLSNYVKKIQVPDTVSRAQGDVHPEGNPHFSLDPYNIPLLAKAIYGRLCAIAPENKSVYTENFNDFTTKWKNKLSQWDTTMQKVASKNAIEYHKLFDYFFMRYMINIPGTLEPIPGIPPTPKHIASLEKYMDTVDFIVQDVYHSDDASQYLAKKFSKPLIVLPHDVGATKDASDIFALFDSIVRRITQ